MEKTKKLKILFQTKKYHPSCGGMYEVTKQLAERLASFGHEVTIATPPLPSQNGNEDERIKIKEIDLKGGIVAGFSGDLRAYQDYLINNPFDIICTLAAQHAMGDAMLPIMDSIKAKKVFVPTGFSAFYMPEFQDYFKKMKNWMLQYDMNVFLSNDYRDVNYARENGIEKIIIIPNGADEKEFLNASNADIRKMLGIAEDDFFILHVGSHTKQKGHDEAMEIFKKADIKNSVFLICGHPGACLSSCERKAAKLNKGKKFKEKNKRIIIKLLERPAAVAAFKEADLFLFPSNIECSPIVLFESMAGQTAFLASGAGNAVEIIDWSKGGLLMPGKTVEFLDNYFIGYLKGAAKKILKRFGFNVMENNYKFVRVKINESTRLLENIYNDKNLRDELAENGYNAWLNKFTWDKIARQYEELFLSLIEEK